MKRTIPLVAVVISACALLVVDSQLCLAQNYRKPKTVQSSKARKANEFSRTRERREAKSRANVAREARRVTRESERNSIRAEKNGYERNLIENKLPRGFRNATEFKVFTRKLNSELIKAGCPKAEILFQGSSVTGREFEPATGRWTGRQFDVGRTSDFDIAICSKPLFEKAMTRGIEIHGNSRTEKLGSPHLQRKLGLDRASRSLESLMGGRPVEFKVFESRKAALERGPSILVNRNTF